MEKITSVGIDLAKSVFSLHGVDDAGRVIVDSDLALLYGVPAKRFNEQVRRNLKRFPPDFMFRLENQEFVILRSQIATSSWGGRRYLPFVFTEHGTIMAASILNSARAIEVSVYVVRAFVQILEAIRQLTQPPLAPKGRRIGFL